MELSVLGPLKVVRHGAEVVLPRRRQQLVLARLLVDAGRVVAAERLMEDVWGSSAARRGTGPARTNVWELRRLIHARAGDAGEGETDAVLVSRPGGYLLDVDRSQVDSVRFEDLLAEARTTGPDTPERGVAALDDGLALCRGSAFGDLAAEPALQPEAMRLDQIVLEARELRAELLLDLGRHAQVAAELVALARAHPERERLWALLMVALYRSGRQSEALRCYQEARATLVDAIGVEPGPELRQLEQAVLRHDPVLHWATRWSPFDGQPPSQGYADGAGSLPPPRPSGQPTGGTNHAVHGLPSAVSSLVGRDTERRAVAAALDRSRLVTVVGVGGCGKTRLAMAVAEYVAPRFPGGVWFVDLASTTATDHLPTALAAALGEGRNLLAADPSAHPRGEPDDEALLVLDNCEHLVEAVAEHVTQLVTQRPALRILATSREALHVEAEIVWRLQGLDLPEPDGRGAFLGSDAVELFVRRGAVSLAGFAPQGETLEFVGRICRHLDGLPLAIELAAALVGSLPVAEIAGRLDRRFGLLTGWRHPHVGRHRTLRAALDWSFDLLDPPMQELLTRLGVFVGSFDLAAVEAVVADEAGAGGLAAAQGVGHLVQTSLVEPVGGHDGVERYRLLETVRQYTVERLERRRDHEEVRRRHARYFAGLATEADRHMRGPASAAWMERLETQFPNLRAALRWAMAHDTEVALRMLGSLRWFLSHLAVLDDLAGWFDVQLSQRSALPWDLELSLLNTTSTIALLANDPVRLREVSTEAAALAQRLDEPRQLAPALVGCAASALVAREQEDAHQYLREAHALCSRLGDRWGLAWTMVGGALLAYQAGSATGARQQLDEALEILRGLRDLRSLVFPLGLRALQALMDEDVDRARDLAAEAADIVASLDLHQLEPFALGVLGLAELAALRLPAARDLLLRCLRHVQASNVDIILWVCLDGLAILAAAAGRHDGAVALVGAGARAGRPSPPALPDKWVRTIDTLLAVARSTLGTYQVERGLARGQDLSLDEAIALAEAATAPLAPTASASA